MSRLSKAEEDAAQMIAAGEITIESIAQIVGVSSRTLRNWRKVPAFLDRVGEIREEYRAEIHARGIAVRENRVAAYNERWRRLQRVMDERANDPRLADIPGGNTGLVVITDWKKIGMGGEDDKEPIMAPVASFDAALFKELRELEKQAAMEPGPVDREEGSRRPRCNNLGLD